MATSPGYYYGCEGKGSYELFEFRKPRPELLKMVRGMARHKRFRFVVLLLDKYYDHRSLREP